jgi:SAM-dependent methyltransferase
MPLNSASLSALSAAAERNKQPILETLRGFLPAQGQALEIASGTGQHVAWFAQQLPGWTWLPTDRQDTHFADIEAHIQVHIQASVAERLQGRVAAPRLLDVQQEPWPLDEARFDLIYCANLLHIAPWACCGALMRGAARHLAPGGRLVTYGPYLEDETPTADSNLAFDASLRARNSDWGLRRREDVAEAAQAAGLRLVARHALPANNLLLVWQTR